MDPRALLIRNEQAKLTATYLNGVAIGIFAVGSLAPTVAIFSGSAQSAWSGRIVLLALSSLMASIVLHLFARTFLKGMQA